MDLTRPWASRTLLACRPDQLGWNLLVGALIALPVSGQTNGKKVAGTNATANGGPVILEPVPVPEGYPIDLGYIRGGRITLGVGYKAIIEAAELLGRGSEHNTKAALRLMTRELGRREFFLNAFALGRHEVTNEQFHVYVKKRWPKTRFPFPWWKADDVNKQREVFYKKHKGKAGMSFKPEDYWLENWPNLKWELPEALKKLPVTYVSYADAVGYCSSTGLRLASEAEWQRAYQGDKPTSYLWGDKWNDDASSKMIGYKSIRDQKIRAAGVLPHGRSPFGLDDMGGNVWEWTQTPFLGFDNYRKTFRNLQKWVTKKKKWKALAEDLWAADKRLIKGGSFNNFSQGKIAFRTTTRMKLGQHQTVEDLGFRVAKSLQPALDTSTLWYRNRFDRTVLGDLELDLPSIVEQLRAARGKGRSYEQLGIERWTLDGELIRGYDMVSFAPVKQLKFRNERALRESAAKDKKGSYGQPIGSVFTTLPFSVQQGLKTFASLDPDMYVVYYRAGLMPRELDIAMRAGQKVLKFTKGVRPKEGDPNPKAVDKKSSRKKKAKKAKKAKQDESTQKLAKDWMEIVDRYGIPDEITEKYPRKRPETMMIRPGNLLIPIKKNILLFRRHDSGDYIAWAEYRKPLRKVSTSTLKPALTIVNNSGKLEYDGGPRTHVSNYRYQFKISIKLADGELQKNGWITPASNSAALPELEKLVPQVQAKPKDNAPASGKQKGK